MYILQHVQQPKLTGDEHEEQQPTLGYSVYQNAVDKVYKVL